MNLGAQLNSILSTTTSTLTKAHPSYNSQLHLQFFFEGLGIQDTSGRRVNCRQMYLFRPSFVSKVKDEMFIALAARCDG